jgi:hypothetical protein
VIYDDCSALVDDMRTVYDRREGALTRKLDETGTHRFREYAGTGILAVVALVLLGAVVWFYVDRSDAPKELLSLFTLSLGYFIGKKA